MLMNDSGCVSIASGWELITRKTNYMIRQLELWPSPTPSEGSGLETEFNLMTNDLTNHACIMKLQ